MILASKNSVGNLRKIDEQNQSERTKTGQEIIIPEVNKVRLQKRSDNFSAATVHCLGWTEYVSNFLSRNM